MGCSGCKRRRSRLRAWLKSLWSAKASDIPAGVPGALRLANQLKEHCAKHGLSGEFARVIVPREEDDYADTSNR
jgi:hypothetical protein